MHNGCRVGDTRCVFTFCHRLMRESIRLPTQVLVAATGLSALALAYYSGELYEREMQEDRFVEWLTAALFAIGGVIRLRQAVENRRPFDGLVAVFCFFVAGEEFSWGQRLIGYTPPTWFLAHNVQQETTLHNFAGVFGRPKWSLIVVLIGYGLLLPLARRIEPMRKVLDKVGATPPPDSLVPWYAMTVGFLVWYPISYSGEWLELVSSVLFLGAATTTSVFAGSVVAGALAALMLTFVSAHRGGGASGIACARAEVSGLLDDVIGGAGTVDLLAGTSSDQRVRSAMSDGEIDGSRLAKFGSTSCAGSIPSSRRRYAVDPWGSSYWISVEGMPDDSALMAVYSLGPNRRKDGRNEATNDDIVARRSIDPFGGAPSGAGDP